MVDIDGVISLFGGWTHVGSEQGDQDHGGSIDGSWHSIDGTLHFLSSTAAAHLLDLSKTPFELVWASGWEERANEHLPHLLGMPPQLPFLRFTRAVGRSNTHWKLWRDRLLRVRTAAGVGGRRARRRVPPVGVRRATLRRCSSPQTHSAVSARTRRNSSQRGLVPSRRLYSHRYTATIAVRAQHSATVVLRRGDAGPDRPSDPGVPQLLY